jgi:20S proteasome subunit beta 3
VELSADLHSSIISSLFSWLEV